MKDSSQFPWRLYRRHLLGQIFFVLPPFIAFLVVFRIFLVKYGAENTAQSLIDVFSQSSFWLIGGLVFLFILFQVFWGLYIFSPLGRVLKEARAIEFGNPLGPLEEEPDEWFELQMALRKIQIHSEEERSDMRGHSQFFEDTLQSLYEGVLIVDRDQNILFMNKTLRDLTKERGSKVLHLRDLFREPEVLRTFVHAQDVGETQRVTLDLEIGDADSQHTFVLHVLPLKRLGIVNGVAGIFNEITELKMAEHFRTDLVANVSHEIRTPLTSLKGYAQALNSEIEKGSTETAKKYLDIMGRSMDRLNHLVSDLLDLSSLEGRAQLHIDESSTKELTDQVLTQLSQEIKTRGHVVNQHVAVPTLACDSIRVEQVLLNLLQNAVRYIPQGSQIDIFWESTKNGVLLKVKDNGPGISKEHLPRLFERFYRADKARSPDKGGTGLGLAIVKHIMQRHGGSVTVESTLGKGTTFTCWFPSQDH